MCEVIALTPQNAGLLARNVEKCAFRIVLDEDGAYCLEIELLNGPQSTQALYIHDNLCDLPRVVSVLKGLLEEILVKYKDSANRLNPELIQSICAGFLARVDDLRHSGNHIQIIPGTDAFRQQQFWRFPTPDPEQMIPSTD